MKNPSNEAPSTISGAAMLANITCSVAPFPRKRYRTRERASNVPRVAEITVAINASLIDRKNAGVRSGTPFHSRYHWVVNPCHLEVTCGSAEWDWLKL